MIKKICAFTGLILLTLLFVSCSTNDRRSKTFYTYFDTVITVVSYGKESQKEFDENCSHIEILLDKYNRLFDIYHEYSGINNLCTVNRNAGKAVEVEAEIIELLTLSKQYWKLTDGELNVMMGAVLKQWHETITETGVLPQSGSLLNAVQYCDINDLIINTDNSTVMLRNENSSLDVGAIAKGFATEKIAQYLEDNGSTSYAINAGGNIRLIGEKPNEVNWSVAIRNPEGSGYSQVLRLHDVSCVTSGVYERNVCIDGEEYHHIIDKDTLKPASYFESVSIVSEDSGYADALSTALFCMSYEEGLALQKKLGNFEAIWIFHDGTKVSTEGIENYV